MHCLQKTWSVITQSEYDSGAICVDTKYGAIENVLYFGGVEVGVRVMERDNSLWYTQMNGKFTGQRAWYQNYDSSAATGNAYEGILNYYPVYEGTTAVVSGNSQSTNDQAGVQWTFFQPKWQPDDYYKNNFRVNKADPVRMLYKDSCASSC